MVCLAVALLCFGTQNSSTPSQVAELRSLIQTAVHKAQLAMPLMPVKRRLLAMSEAGDSLEGPNDVAALALLQQAWDISLKDPLKLGINQIDIVMSIGSINPSRGRKMISEIQDKYWRSFTERSFPSALSIRHPKLAANLFDTSNDQDLNEEVARLCNIRLDIGIGFLKLFPNSVIERTIVYVANYLPPKVSSRFLAGFQLSKFKKTRDFWLITHANATGNELEAAAHAMPTLYDQIALNVRAIGAYRKTDPRRAAELTDMLCDSANKGGPKPILAMPTVSIPTEYEYLLIPGVAVVDTLKVRAYLDRVAHNNPQLTMRIVGAWSMIDLEKATHLFDQAITQGLGVEHTDIGNYIDDGCQVYLVNLAKVNPILAAQKFKSLGSLRFGDTSHRDSMKDIYAFRIMRDIWMEYPKQAREFCAQFPPSDELFGKNTSSAVDCLELDREARKDPLHSEMYLRRMASILSTNTSFLGVTPTQTAAAIVKELSLTDIRSALRISAAIASPRERAMSLTTALNDAPDLPYGIQTKLLNAALSIAQTIPDPSDRVFALVEIAQTAKLVWRRLQPWPSTKE